MARLQDQRAIIVCKRLNVLSKSGLNDRQDIERIKIVTVDRNNLLTQNFGLSELSCPVGRNSPIERLRQV